MDPAVVEYIEAIPGPSRPLFERIHQLVLEACPEAEVALSYKMPAYRCGERRLYVGVWKHGISLYGWGADRDGGFSARHPELMSGRATLRLRPADAGRVSDGEIRELARATLNP